MLTVRAFLCVFITAGPITKLFAGGGGGENLHFYHFIIFIFFIASERRSQSMLTVNAFDNVDRIRVKHRIIARIG
jgi:hypothetical protein